MPILLEDTFLDFPELHAKVRCELAVLRFVILSGDAFDHVGAVVLHLLEFSVDSFDFGGGAPGLMPVDFGVGTGSCADHFEHPFCWVCVGGAGVGAVAFEVAC